MNVFCFTKKSRAFCEQMMLRADVHKQIHNKADDLFFTSHLDLSGSIYINCFYSLQHWLCKPRQNLNQTHAATSLPAQTLHSVIRNCVCCTDRHQTPRDFTEAHTHLRLRLNNHNYCHTKKERALLEEPPPVKKKKNPPFPHLKVKVQQPRFNNAKAEWKQKDKGKVLSS